jgi:Delta3-Delta2-enoyl-CoA isomerase
MADIRESWHEQLLILAFDRPPVNAFNRALLAELAQRLEQFNTKPAAGLIITGQGRGFSGGLDLHELTTLDAAGLRELLGLFIRVLGLIARAPVPVVAAINGTAPAGGAVLSLCADVRLMVQSSHIGVNEVAVGVTPGPLVYALLKRLIGARQAALALTGGQMYTSEQALALGLVDECHAADQLLPAAHGWLKQRLSLPAYAYTRTRQLVREDLVALLQTPDISEQVTDWLRPEVRLSLQQVLARKFKS